jgi:hypothetical protein
MGYTLEASKKDSVVVVARSFGSVWCSMVFLFVRLFKTTTLQGGVHVCECVCGKCRNESCVGMWVVMDYQVIGNYVIYQTYFKE